MDAESVDLLFLTQSADLEYLTGVERDIPNFGEASYAHGWVTGAFFRPGAEPVFVFPRMFVAFHLQDQLPTASSSSSTRRTTAWRSSSARPRPRLAEVGRDRRPRLGRDHLHLAAVFGAERLRTGSALVNELRRVKTTEELEAMGRAIRTVEQTMAAVTPLVLPGVTMAQLVEAIEHELREAGSRSPSFATHISPGSATATSTRTPTPRTRRCRKTRR